MKHLLFRMFERARRMLQEKSGSPTFNDYSSLSLTINTWGGAKGGFGGRMVVTRHRGRAEGMGKCWSMGIKFQLCRMNKF